MFGFLRRKKKTTALDAGTALLVLAGGAEDRDLKLAKRLNVDSRRVSSELAYLRMFAVTHAACRWLPDNRVREAVLQVYRKHIDGMAALAASPDGFREEVMNRFGIYNEAVRGKPPDKGLWAVGCAFVELCGLEKDAGVVDAVSNEFAGTCWAVKEVMKSIEIVL